MRLHERRTDLLALTLAASLAACGGGDDGLPAPPSEPAPITAENATLVAQGMPMTLELVDFQETMGFETLTAEGEGTTACPDGGSITAGFAVDAAPVGVVSSGDRYTVDFNGCMLGQGLSINGGIAIDFNTITGDWEVDDVWEVDLDFTVDGLTFSGGGATGFFDGGWSQNASYDGGDSAFSLVGDFTVSANDGSGLVASSLTDLTLSCAYDAVAGQGSYTVDGRFASTELGGSITLETLSPLVRTDGAPYPESGVLRATGSGGSVLTLTVLDDTFVQIEVDEDGDDVQELTVTTTWAELDA